MNKPGVFALALIFCLCGTVAGAQKHVTSQDLWTADWSQGQAHKLNSMSIHEVRNSMDPIWVNDASHLCAFQFVDLRRSGTLSLVLSSDGGGTVDCNDVDVIDKSPTGIEDYDLSNGSSYFDSVEDLNGNGNQELIIDQKFALNRGSDNCIATWPVIYAWTGSGYADVSISYKGWYKERLASLNKKIAADEEPQDAAGQMRGESAAGNGSQPIQSYSVAGNVPEGSQPAQSLVPNSLVDRVRPIGASLSAPQPTRGLSCLEAEAVKIESFLDVPRDDAYVNDAIRWANSEDSADREFAAVVLSNIGTPEALDYLKTLSQDSNPEVAQEAKWKLAKVGQPLKVYSVSSEAFSMAQLAPTSP